MPGRSDPYVSVSQYRNAVGEIQAQHDEMIRRDLISASRYLDQVTGRFFGQSTEELFFEGSGGYLLRIDDIASTTALVVKVDDDGDGVAETTISSGNYQLRPLNAASGSPARPWDEIAIPGWSNRSHWPAGALVAITATWGWPSVPSQIQVAVIEICKLIELVGPRATNRIDDGGIPLLLNRDARASTIISQHVLPFQRAVVA